MRILKIFEKPCKIDVGMDGDTCDCWGSPCLWVRERFVNPDL